RDKPIKPVPWHLARRHVVDQAGKIVGERERGGGSMDHKRRLAAIRRRELLRPPLHQLGEQQAPLQITQRWREFERGGGGTLSNSDLSFVEVAERGDAGQNRRIDLDHIKKDLTCEPARPSGRQVKCGGCECEGVRAGSKARNEGAVDERSKKRRQKGRGRRN